MYKTDLAIDLKETAAIERRRNMETQRQSRIFNARERIIGVDLDALGHQTKERKLLEGIESQRKDAFAKEMLRSDQVAELLQQRQDKDTKKINEAVVGYRKECQRPMDRREYDLYDPDSKKKDQPARVSDGDPRCTVSGAQFFQGEDLSFEDRKTLQQEQTREWTSQQFAERQRMSSEQRKADQLYDLKAIELDQRSMELAAAEEQARHNLNTSVKEYNQSLLKEQRAQEQLQKTQEQDDNYTEMANHIHGDFLTEDPTTASSAFGSHRVIPDRWKGMSQEQMEEVRKTQEVQRIEKQRELGQEHRLEEEWDHRRVTEARAGMVLDRQLDKSRKHTARSLAEENKRIAVEQRVQKEHLNKEVYTNRPTDQYFMQFNTSSR